MTHQLPAASQSCPIRYLLYGWIVAVILLTASMPAAPADGILIDKVWSGHPVGFAILTERGHQFIAYYDAERKITVAGRKLGETNWTRVQPEGSAWSAADALPTSPAGTRTTT